MKYLLTLHADIAHSDKIVFSRFEFRKFWFRWRKHHLNLTRPLNEYLSFIHLRDLLIAEYIKRDKSGELTPKFRVATLDTQGATARKLTEKLAARARETGHNFFEEWESKIENLVKAIYFGNRKIMDAVISLPEELRVLLIAELVGEKMLVTIFDGMDSVKIQDSFENTPEFREAKEIIGLRSTATNYLSSALNGRPLNSGSLVVMRANTSALLHGEKTELGINIEFHTTYKVAPLKPLVALAKVTFDTADRLIDFHHGKDTTQRNILVVDLLVIIQRTVGAIRQSGGRSNELTFDEVYGMFDGNIRELLEFFIFVLVRHYREMARHDYFPDMTKHETVLNVVRDLTDEGFNFLKRKSYRIVEFLLHDEGEVFENRILRHTPSELDIMKGREGKIRLAENPNSTGRVDNIFNYFDGSREHSSGRFSFLEKIRIIQVVTKQSGGMEHIKSELKSRFGIDYPNTESLRPILLIMLKTDFLQVKIGDNINANSLVFEPTNRAIISVRLLVRNLAYIEHTFHQTSYPSKLINSVMDEKRDGKVFNWTVSAIRNAYIFLTYLKYVENRNPNGTVIESTDRIFEKIRKDIIRTVKKMVKDNHQPLTSNSASSSLQRDDYAWRSLPDEALLEIMRVRADWLKQGVF